MGGAGRQNLQIPQPLKRFGMKSCFGAADRRATNDRLPELFQKPDIPLEEQLQIIQPILQHRDPVHTHPKRKARDFLGIISIVLHEFENIRVHHPATENFNPSRLLAWTARSVIVTSPTPPAADEAGHEHFRARLSEREKRWPEAGLHV